MSLQAASNGLIIEIIAPQKLQMQTCVFVMLLIVSTRSEGLCYKLKIMQFILITTHCSATLVPKRIDCLILNSWTPIIAVSDVEGTSIRKVDSMKEKCGERIGRVVICTEFLS